MYVLTFIIVDLKIGEILHDQLSFLFSSDFFLPIRSIFTLSFYYFLPSLTVSFIFSHLLTLACNDFVPTLPPLLLIIFFFSYTIFFSLFFSFPSYHFFTFSSYFSFSFPFLTYPFLSYLSTPLISVSFYSVICCLLALSCLFTFATSIDYYSFLSFLFFSFFSFLPV